MKEDRKAALKKIKTLVFTQKSEIEDFRNTIEQNFSSVFIPNGIEKIEKEFGGIKCDVLVPEASVSRRVLLYIHGGAFVGGSRDSYRNFCGSLAKKCNCRVIVPEFRLPPSHPYPAGLEDVQSAFDMVLASLQVKMSTQEIVQEPEIIIAADSSGATLALALLLNLSEKFRLKISSVILFSPWLDLTPESFPAKRRYRCDEVMSVEDIMRSVDLYTYSSNVVNSDISPLHSSIEQFVSFPKVYIQSGEKELLLPQQIAFADLLRQAGVNVTHEIFPSMPYLFQLCDDCLPQAFEALDNIGSFINVRTEE